MYRANDYVSVVKIDISVVKIDISGATENQSSRSRRRYRENSARV